MTHAPVIDSPVRLPDLLPPKPCDWLSPACQAAVATLRLVSSEELQWLKLTGIPALQLARAGVKRTPKPDPTPEPEATR